MKKKELEIQSDTTNTTNESTQIPNTSNSMVDIVVRIKQDETFANLKVSSFDLILSLEFLLKLAQFVSVPQDPNVKPINTNAVTNTSSKRKFLYFIFRMFRFMIFFFLYDYFIL